MVRRDVHTRTSILGFVGDVVGGSGGVADGAFNAVPLGRGVDGIETQFGTAVERTESTIVCEKGEMTCTFYVSSD